MEEIVKQHYENAFNELKAHKENASITANVLKVLIESGKTISAKEALKILDDSKELLLMVTKYF
jgi:hypothetical protein